MTLRLAVLIAITFLVLIGTLFAMRISHAPYLWIFPCWSAIFFLVATLSKATIAKAISINLAAAASILSLAEGYWTSQKHENTSGYYAGSYTDDYFLKHEFLGHAPSKSAKVTSTKIYQDKVLYDVVYNTDQHGLRIAPPHQEDSSKCLLFFGGSFTYGEGVSDEQTMPYRAGVLSEGRYRVYNFGFHAYGAHQMLSALQHGLVEQIIECKPKHVIYLGMVAHIARSAGLVPWEHHGPRYVLEPDGRLIFGGRFDQKPKSWLATHLRLESSQIYSRILGKQRAVNSNDVDLYLDIVTAARDSLLADYPESEFHVLLWGHESDRTFRHLLEAMNKRKINTHPLSRIIPSYSVLRNHYEVSPSDKHPNALSHDLVARYVVNSILD